MWGDGWRAPLEAGLKKLEDDGHIIGTLCLPVVGVGGPELEGPLCPGHKKRRQGRMGAEVTR